MRSLLILFFCLPYLAVPAFVDIERFSTDSMPVVGDIEFNQRRFTTAALVGGAAYMGASVALYESWYKAEGLGAFHFENDFGQWRNMDKAGHFFTAYMQSRWTSAGARWVGIDERKSDWLGFGMGIFLQSTVEVMDGFAREWGFSWSDMLFNVMGSGLFLGQQNLWQEQRISVKYSINYNNYSEITYNLAGEPVFLGRRADDLFGRSFASRMLKDYNAQTIWASVNLRSISGIKPLPSWLNMAVGYGAEGLFGGYDNIWEDEGITFHYDVPRYSQFYLSPDIDFTRIPTKSRFLRTVFEILNVIKFPAPAIEFNTTGRVLWHWVYF